MDSSEMAVAQIFEGAKGSTLAQLVGWTVEAGNVLYSEIHVLITAVRTRVQTPSLGCAAPTCSASTTLADAPSNRSGPKAGVSGWRAAQSKGCPARAPRRRHVRSRFGGGL